MCELVLACNLQFWVFLSLKGNTESLLSFQCHSMATVMSLACYEDLINS